MSNPLISDPPKNMYERHIVLVSPEVHWNTGNIGRTCLGTGASLHLIKPLGFSLDSTQVKRAGLDYWHNVDLHVWDSFDQFLISLDPAKGELLLFSKSATNTMWQIPLKKRLFLIFGSETKGLPQQMMTKYADQLYRIPTTKKIRCLNLSTAVGIALYTSLRPSTDF